MAYNCVRAAVLDFDLRGLSRATPAAPSPAVAGSIRVPISFARDAIANVYFAGPDLNCVFKRAPNGVLTPVAGSLRQGYSWDGGPAAYAQRSRAAGGAGLNRI